MFYWLFKSNGWEFFLNFKFLLLNLSSCRFFVLNFVQQFRISFWNLFLLTSSLEQLFSFSQFCNFLVNFFNWRRSQDFQWLKLVLDIVRNAEDFLFFFFILIFVFVFLATFFWSFFFKLRLFRLNNLNLLIFPLRIRSNFRTNIDCLFFFI